MLWSVLDRMSAHFTLLFQEFLDGGWLRSWVGSGDKNARSNGDGAVCGGVISSGENIVAQPLKRRCDVYVVGHPVTPLRWPIGTHN